MNNDFDVFKNKGLHFLHLNVNSLLPKIDEIRLLAIQTNAAILGISETKLDNSIFDSEISIDNYHLIRYDRDRRGGGVAYYVKNNICYTVKNGISNGIENIFLDLLFPKTKPISIGIIYKPPNENRLLEEMTKHFETLRLSDEIHILGDLNINLLHNGKMVLSKNAYKNRNSREIFTTDVKK